MRDGKSLDWRIISHIDMYKDHRKSSVIFEQDGEIWMLLEDIEILLDVVRMPSYIAGDWLCANRQAAAEPELDVHIEEIVRRIKLKKSIEKENVLAELRAAKRNARIGRII